MKSAINLRLWLKKAGVSVNRLIDDWATYAIAESEVFYRYEVMSQNSANHLGDAVKILNDKAKNKGAED